MQAPNRDLTESSGGVFFLDILSHRMSIKAILRQRLKHFMLARSWFVVKSCEAANVLQFLKSTNDL
jgi:hypothetical protein